MKREESETFLFVLGFWGEFGGTGDTERGFEQAILRFILDMRIFRLNLDMKSLRCDFHYKDCGIWIWRKVYNNVDLNEKWPVMSRRIDPLIELCIV